MTCVVQIAISIGMTRSFTGTIIPWVRIRRSPVWSELLLKRVETLLQIHDFAEVIDHRIIPHRSLYQCARQQGRSRQVPLSCSKTDPLLIPSQPSMRCCCGNRGYDSHVSFTPITVDFKDVSANAMEKRHQAQNIQKAFDLPKSSRWAVPGPRYPPLRTSGSFIAEIKLGAENLYTAITLSYDHGGGKSYARWKTVAEKVAPRAIFDAGASRGISFAVTSSHRTWCCPVSLRVLEWHFWNLGYLTVV